MGELQRVHKGKKENWPVILNQRDCAIFEFLYPLGHPTDFKSLHMRWEKALKLAVSYKQRMAADEATIE